MKLQKKLSKEILITVNFHRNRYEPEGRGEPLVQAERIIKS